MESYYDDLRYNDEHIAQLQLQAHANQYPSPYKQSSGPQSNYSPLVRRDDPTVPLYATLKPKMHQRQYTSNYINNNSNYVAYSTIHRSTLSNTTATPPSKHLNNNNNNNNNNNFQVLPPPPPPPPPVKPKRTFEYGPANDMHSESGTFLLANDYEGNNHEMITEQLINKNLKHRHQRQQEGSATSLDEEDLEEDLKDFEDVTFDNLRKPGQAKLRDKNSVLKGEDNHTSEQSLLIKSSESSSQNTISNVPISSAENANNPSPTELENSGSKNLNDQNSNNTLTTGVDASSNNTDLIYEETEI